MQIIRMNEIEPVTNARGITARQLLSHKNTTIMNLLLKPGDTVPEHAVPVDVFFYIVSGKGTLKIGDEEAVVGATDIVVCPPNTKMSLRADQNENFYVLNVKTPSLGY